MVFTMAAEMEKFVALGKEIGLEGEELRSFVKEQQDLVREECFRAREAEREAREAAKEQQERQAQLQKEAEERQAQLQKVAREAEREHELQLAKIKADQGSANHSGQGNPSQTSAETAKPKLPRFDEKHDDMDTFIERF